MKEASDQDWDRARSIVRILLGGPHNYSIRQLADEADIQASIISRFLNRKSTLDSSSVLKLYPIIAQRLGALDGQVFLEVTGLAALVKPIISINTRLIIEKKGGPQAYAEQLIWMGNQLTLKSWEQALALFREAEQLLGTASVHAAEAVCMTAQMLINMGDYDGARKELDRVENIYGLVIDDATNAEVNRLRGWIDYFQGNLSQAEIWFQNCIKIAKRTGVSYLSTRLLCKTSLR